MFEPGSKYWYKDEFLEIPPQEGNHKDHGFYVMDNFQAMFPGVDMPDNVGTEYALNHGYARLLVSNDSSTSDILWCEFNDSFTNSQKLYSDIVSNLNKQIERIELDTPKIHKQISVTDFLSNPRIFSSVWRTKMIQSSLFDKESINLLKKLDRTNGEGTATEWYDLAQDFLDIWASDTDNPEPKQDFFDVLVNTVGDGKETNLTFDERCKEIENWIKNYQKQLQKNRRGFYLGSSRQIQSGYFVEDEEEPRVIVILQEVLKQIANLLPNQWRHQFTNVYDNPTVLTVWPWHYDKDFNKVTDELRFEFYNDGIIKSFENGEPTGEDIYFDNQGWQQFRRGVDFVMQKLYPKRIYQSRRNEMIKSSVTFDDFKREYLKQRENHTPYDPRYEIYHNEGKVTGSSGCKDGKSLDDFYEVCKKFGLKMHTDNLGDPYTILNSRSNNMIKSNYYLVSYENELPYLGHYENRRVIKADSEDEARDKFERTKYYGSIITEIEPCDENGNTIKSSRRNNMVKSAYTREEIVKMSNEGYHAFMDNKKITDCPYDDNSVEKNYWIEGYKGAEHLWNIRESYNPIKSAYTREDYDRFDSLGDYNPYEPSQEELAKKEEIKKALREELPGAYEPDPMDNYAGYDSTNERIVAICDRIADRFGTDTDWVEELAAEIEYEGNARQMSEADWVYEHCTDKKKYWDWYMGEDVSLEELGIDEEQMNREVGKIVRDAVEKSFGKVNSSAIKSSYSPEKITADTQEEFYNKIEALGYEIIDDDGKWLTLEKFPDVYDVEYTRYFKGDYELYPSDIKHRCNRVESSKTIKSSPDFKEFTADDIFDDFSTYELIHSVFMDREECKEMKCGWDEFSDLMYDVLPTYLGVYTANDVREVCRRAKNPQAKAFLEAFETCLENAKWVDKFYDSVTVHKKGIKSSVEPWDVSQVTGTSDEDLGLSAVVEEYGNEFVNVDTAILEQIKDKLVQYFDDEAYVRDWNINYPNDQIEDAFDITDPEEMDVDDLVQYFDYEAYGRDIRLNDRMAWDTEDEHWVSLSEVEDENNDRYITW